MEALQPTWEVKAIFLLMLRPFSWEALPARRTAAAAQVQAALAIQGHLAQAAPVDLADLGSVQTNSSAAAAGAARGPVESAELEQERAAAADRSAAMAAQGELSAAAAEHPQRLQAAKADWAAAAAAA